MEDQQVDNPYGLAAWVFRRAGPEFIILLIVACLVMALMVFLWWDGQSQLRSAQLQYTEFQKTLISRIERLESQVDTLQRENAQLKVENARNQGLYASIPIPMWSNWRDGLIRRVNPAYISRYYTPRGLSASACIDQPNSACWPPDVARGFDRHNEMVMQLRRPLVFCERLPTGKHSLYIKYPSYSGTELVGVDGMEIPGGACESEGMIDFSKLRLRQSRP